MGIVYLLLHKGGLCHVHLAQSVQLGNAPVSEAPASFFSRKPCLSALFVPSEHLVIGRQFIACVIIIPLISPIGTIAHVTQAKFF